MTTLVKNKKDKEIFKAYLNKGFALVYSKEIYNEKKVSQKIDERSLIIFQKNLNTNTLVKITNILNNKSIIATVGKKSKYPPFYNSVISRRIAEDLDLNIDQPYIEILEIHEHSTFVAQKAKTYKEEQSVAVKAPVNNVSIKNLNKITSKDIKKSITKFTYIVKIVDFYFNETALMMLNRIKTESSIKNPKIKKISDKKYRVYLGPFDNINTLQKSYNDISIFEFENLEIIRND